MTAAAPKYNRERLWTAGKVALALILTAIVLAQVQPAALAALAGQLAFAWLLPSIALFQFMIVIMARRSWHLLEAQLPFPQLLGLTVIQTVIGNLVATGAGLASYVALLRGKHQVALQQGIASVLLAKLGDLIALLMLLAISSALVWSQIAAVHALVLLLIGGMAAAVLAIVAVVVVRERAVRGIRRVFRRLHIEQTDRAQRLLAALDAVVQQNPRRARRMLLRLIGYSALLAGVQIAFAYCNMQLFAVPIDLAQIAFISSLIFLISLVPIQVFGGLGVSEISGLFIYGLFVPDPAFLAAFVIGMRIYAYLLNALLLPYLLIESYIGRRPTDREEA